MSQKWLDILCKYLLDLTSKYLLNLTSKYLLDLLSKYMNHMFGCPPSPPPIIPIIPVIPVSTYWTWPVSTYWTCLVSTWIICLVDHKIHQKWFIWGILWLQDHHKKYWNIGKWGVPWKRTKNVEKSKKPDLSIYILSTVIAKIGFLPLFPLYSP